jgi:hypothetical protein
MTLSLGKVLVNAEIAEVDFDAGNFTGLATTQELVEFGRHYLSSSLARTLVLPCRESSCSIFTRRAF